MNSPNKLSSNVFSEIDADNNVNQNIHINSNPEDLIKVFNLNRELDFYNYCVKTHRIKDEKISDFYKTRNKKFNTNNLKDSLSISHSHINSNKTSKKNSALIKGKNKLEIDKKISKGNFLFTREM